jgi:energy-coupling factor transporter ATP-binding protein EcfA2
MSNPFATRFIRPGAMPFIFLDGESAASLVDRLRQQQWWGQIIGPHGSGKSTLLATLIPTLTAAGRHVVSHTLHQGEHRLAALHRESFSPSTQLMIDGYEQLSWWQKRRVKSHCRRAGCGLLVTAHADVGLPTVYRTQSSESLAATVVSRLLPATGHEIATADIAAAYSAAEGNVRETLFKLYDVYQQRSPDGR